MRFAWVNLALGLIGFGCSSSEVIQGSGCESCHRPADQPGGLEAPHPMAAIACVDCHGGNPNESSVGAAHVPNPTGGDLRNLGWTQLAATDPAYRRFVNPSDPSAATQSCGTGSTCHQAIVEQVARSVHTTGAGVINVPRIIQGLETQPRYAFTAATDPNPDNGAKNQFASLEVLPPAPAVTPASTLSDFVAHSFSKACSGCHLGAYGAIGPGRSQQLLPNGCAACHVPYAKDALGTSADPTVNRTEAGHPLRHSIEKVVKDEQCSACHYRSLRIGTQFRGLREITEADRERGTEHLALSTEVLHGRPAGSYVIDDDTRDTLDTTPPDVHHERGLGCVDCHFGADVHGDGHLPGTAGGAQGIECSDCHGTFERELQPVDGQFRTTGGAVLARLRKEADGRYLLRGALDGLDHPVTQITNLRRTPLVTNAHSEARHGDLECYSCHTAWMQNFYLSERILDLRVMEKSSADGETTPGAVTEVHWVVGLENIHLGINGDGKVGTFLFDNTFPSVIVPCDPRTEPVGCESTPSQPIFGKKVIDRALEWTPNGLLSLGYYPSFAHTVGGRGKIQPCERCHPRQYEVEPARPAAAFGLGSGKWSWSVRGTSDPVDLTRVVDALGAPQVPFPRPGTKPVPPEVVRAALDYEVILPLR